MKTEFEKYYLHPNTDIWNSRKLILFFVYYKFIIRFTLFFQTLWILSLF